MFSKKLILKKTHDFCLVKKPELTAIFIHGIAADSTSFSRALEYLEGTTSMRGVRFIAFDLLGSGESLKGDELNYSYSEQIEALYNSIKKLQISGPMVLVGHSMGALIATKYADTYKKQVRELILVSPPTYTPSDLENPIFQAEMDAFKKLVKAKDRQYINNKAFDNSIAKIVLNKYNYKRLAELKTPAVLIYSDADRTVMPANIRRVIRENPKYLSGITTIGTHRVARDKYSKILEVLEGVLNA